jgi:small subunit ribosomal protein S2
MPVATRRELLEAGVHFGHQTKRWNPKMRRYLFGQRSGIYIIDLEQTLTGLQEAYNFLRDVAARGGAVLFVGTKKQAQEIVAEQATRVNMPYVNTRWLGGMLTNFQTIFGRLKRLKELRDMERGGAFEFLPKKEVLKLRHEKEKLERNLSGIQDMERVPSAVYVVDTKKEQIAVTEARKLGIPVVAIVDTNCDPDEVDFVIPGNDDAIRACAVITKVMADAIQEGQYLAYQRMQTQVAEPEIEREPGPAGAPVAPTEEARSVTLSAEEAAWMGVADDQGAAAAPSTPQEPETAGTPAEEEPGETPAAPEAEAPVGAAAETPAESEASRTWAAPGDPSALETRTSPDPAGPAADAEIVESEADSVSAGDEPAPLPAGEGEETLAPEEEPPAGPTDS